MGDQTIMRRLKRYIARETFAELQATVVWA